MEQFPNKDKTPAKNTLPSQKHVKQKKGWWHWFKNLSIEPRKIVIWDGDKVTLLPAPPEGEVAAIAVEKPAVTVEKPVAVAPVVVPKPPVAPIPPVAPPKPVVKKR